ncbi:MAG: cytochrome-c peroxidase [Bacteroidota bacterium]|nr:cytochrome-c peroxidase [Bacteroidota bacterium]MDX5448120.1 cytochrome-c peroxidase [Bacteroidota bacterium]
MRSSLPLVAIFAILLVSCQKDDSPSLSGDAHLNLPSTPYDYSLSGLPSHLANDPGMNAMDNEPLNNPVTDEGATLGRVLFYDVNLSKNRTVSCSSCHKPEFGFSDDRVLSIGFDGEESGRHSMGLTNARFYQNGRFFWDERANTLEDQVLMPIQDQVEMGMTLDSVIARLKSIDHYPGLFSDAFGDPGITEERISKALAQFVRSIVSYNTKYDQGRALVQTPVEPFPNFSPTENRGKQIFFNPQLGGCGGCHTTESFSAPRALSNGLDPVITDAGVGGVTGIPQQIGTFKVPSLRNVAIRAPYMHDGRFTTLEEVVEHYNSGVNDVPGLPPGLRDPNTGLPKRLNLTAQQKMDLVAFLQTLTDEALSSDVRFSDPFR